MTNAACGEDASSRGVPRRKRWSARLSRIFHRSRPVAPRACCPIWSASAFEALGIVVGAKGPLASVASRVASALDEFGDLHGYRTFLCHVSSTTTIDPSGRWRLVLNLTSFRAATVQRTSLEITEDEAALVLARLHHARRRLDGQVRGMLASFR